MLRCASEVPAATSELVNLTICNPCEVVAWADARALVASADHDILESRRVSALYGDGSAR